MFFSKKDKKKAILTITLYDNASLKVNGKASNTELVAAITALINDLIIDNKNISDELAERFKSIINVGLDRRLNKTKNDFDVLDQMLMEVIEELKADATKKKKAGEKDAKKKNRKQKD